MPVIRSSLQAEGALVDVILGWSESRARQLRAALRPVPPPITTRALVDSGAEITCVDAALIQQLGLPPGGTVGANLPSQGGLSFGFLTDASMTVVHPSGNPRDHLEIRNHTVLELSLRSLGYDILIGRDILARCRFFYHGPGNWFLLAY